MRGPAERVDDGALDDGALDGGTLHGEALDGEVAEDAPGYGPATRARVGARTAATAVWWRGLGLVGGKSIAVARTLVLAHLLTPTDFGLFAMAIVPLDLLLGVTDLGVAPALVQQAEVSEPLYDVAWTAGVLRGLAVGVVLALGAPLFAAVLGDARATGLVRVLALRPVIAAAASVRVAELERTLRYRALAAVDLSSVVASAVLALALAPSLGRWALVAGSVGGAMVATIASYVAAPYRPRPAVHAEHARSLLHFGGWVLAGGVVALLGETALRAIIARNAGTAALGQYTLAASLASLPIGIAGAAVGAVAFSVHARVQRDDAEAARAYRATLGALAGLLCPATAVLVVVAPSLVRQTLGARWAGTAPTIQLLAVVGLLGLAFDATAPLLQGRGRVRSVAGLYLLFTAGTLAAAWPLTRARGIAGAALARLLAEVLVCAGCVWLAGRTLDRPFRGLARASVAIAGVTLLAALVAAAFVRWLPDARGPIVGGAGALAVVAVVLWQLDQRVGANLSRELRRVLPTGLPWSREDRAAES